MAAMVETPDWAALDPDFAAGKRAIGAGDWDGAIKALTNAALRDDRNADIQNYLGYAYRRLRQFDSAIQHYQRALTLNPRHRRQGMRQICSRAARCSWGFRQITSGQVGLTEVFVRAAMNTTT
jgi:tetratricopeptide (TPR) repeat protein